MPTTDTMRYTGRGYHAVYREHDVNHCPGCGRTHWIIGRMSAECAFCLCAYGCGDCELPFSQGALIAGFKVLSVIRGNCRLQIVDCRL